MRKESVVRTLESAFLLLALPVAFGLCYLGLGKELGLFGILLIFIGVINLWGTVSKYEGWKAGPRSRIVFEALGREAGYKFFRALGWAFLVLGFALILVG